MMSHKFGDFRPPPPFVTLKCMFYNVWLQILCLKIAKLPSLLNMWHHFWILPTTNLPCFLLGQNNNEICIIGAFMKWQWDAGVFWLVKVSNLSCSCHHWHVDWLFRKLLKIMHFLVLPSIIGWSMLLLFYVAIPLQWILSSFVQNT